MRAVHPDIPPRLNPTGPKASPRKLSARKTRGRGNIELEAHTDYGHATKTQNTTLDPGGSTGGKLHTARSTRFNQIKTRGKRLLRPATSVELRKLPFVRPQRKKLPLGTPV